MLSARSEELREEHRHAVESGYQNDEDGYTPVGDILPPRVDMFAHQRLVIEQKDQEHQRRWKQRHRHDLDEDGDGVLQVNAGDQRHEVASQKLVEIEHRRDPVR